MLPFKKRDKNGEVTDEYLDNTCWDNIIDLYRFDRKLRLILFDSIERIEVALRTQLVYQLAHKYGSHWHDNPDLFAVGKKTGKRTRTGKEIELNTFEKIQKHINKQLNGNSHERFITHYKEKYCYPPTPPAWMTVETMFFGDLSYIFKNLASKEDRKNIALYFGLHESVFSSWLHSLNFVRNLCAHHSRVWNKDLNITPIKLKSPSKKWISNSYRIQSNKIYYMLCIINYILQTANPNNTLKSKLNELFNKFPTINKGHMGFPPNWENEPLWRN